MPEEVIKPKSGLKRFVTAGNLRLAGLVLLAALIARLDLGEIREAIRTADASLIALAVVGVIPLILIKTVRWQGLLRAQAIRMAMWPAFLAYFGSLFIGFLTPGRLGEFIKAVHVSRDCDVPLTQAFTSVLADRLFDLYALMVVGSAALLTRAINGQELIVLVSLVVLMVLPLAVFLNGVTFGWMQRVGLRFGAVGRRLFDAGGILPEVRAGLRQLTLARFAAAVALTIFAYGVYFGQCYLLARALDLPVGFGPVTFAVALGSLITLVPVSISGLGTREAAMIAYLDSAGVQAEAALSFSLLVFVTFYIAGGLIGALAWWIKPAPLNLNTNMNRRDAEDAEVS
jgi:uncharacterized protein (TIRG00374 family)